MAEPTDEDYARANLYMRTHWSDEPTWPDTAKLVMEVRAEEQARLRPPARAIIEQRDAAEKKLAELVRDLWLWFNSGVSSELGPIHIDNFEVTLRKYDPKPEGGG